MEMKDIIRLLKEPAHSNIEWVRENPLEATQDDLVADRVC